VAQGPPARRRARPPPDGRRHRRRQLHHRLPGGRRPARPRFARSCSSATTRQDAPPARAQRLGPARASSFAYSKICTHAGCAVALYRKPTYEPTVGAARARLPVPLLGLRHAHGREGRVRPRRAAAAAAAAPGRRGRRAAGRRGPVRLGRPRVVGHEAMIDPVEFVDQRLGTNVVLRKATRYVFPEHWSFPARRGRALQLRGPDRHRHVPRALLRAGHEPRRLHGLVRPAARRADVSVAYASALHLSFDVPAGLLMRQTHHWAADVFLVAIVLPCCGSSSPAPFASRAS